MCDWTYAAYAVLAAGTAAQAESTRKDASQARTQQREAIDKAERERAKVEAEAAQAANTRIAAAAQRRRTQQNLLASGASPTSSTADSPLSTAQPVSRGDPRKTATLIQRGANASFFG